MKSKRAYKFLAVIDGKEREVYFSKNNDEAVELQSKFVLSTVYDVICDDTGMKASFIVPGAEAAAGINIMSVNDYDRLGYYRADEISCPRMLIEMRYNSQAHADLLRCGDAHVLRKCQQVHHLEHVTVAETTKMHDDQATGSSSSSMEQVAARGGAFARARDYDSNDSIAFALAKYGHLEVCKALMDPKVAGENTFAIARDHHMEVEVCKALMDPTRTR